jgi:3-phenylpropionate/trans-cinnamate dioxygenase ferredoxin subunit
MDGFLHLTTTEGIESGGMKVVSIDDHEMLVAHVGDEYFVTDARCPHMGGHLAEGTLEGSIVTCPRHHSQFDLRDGRVLQWTDWEGVKSDVAKLLKHPRGLRTYAVMVQGNDILVGPENPPVAVS